MILWNTDHRGPGYRHPRTRDPIELRWGHGRGGLSTFGGLRTSPATASFAFFKKFTCLFALFCSHLIET